MGLFVEVEQLAPKFPATCAYCLKQPATVTMERSFKHATGNMLATALGPETKTLHPACNGCSVGLERSDTWARGLLISCIPVSVLAIAAAFSLGAWALVPAGALLVLSIILGVRAALMAGRFRVINVGKDTVTYQVATRPYAEEFAALNATTVVEGLFYMGPKASTARELERSHAGGPAFSKVFLAPPRGQGSRSQHLAMLVMVGPVTFCAMGMGGFGSFSIGPLQAILLCSAAGALGGAFYHPIRRFWRQGCVAGAFAGAGALLATVFYLEGRTHIYNVEILIPMAVGALPALGAYWLLMRKQRVGTQAPVRAAGPTTPTGA